ncbi:MAG: L,D-transpeptidase family protein [Parvibaculaceae bacterium]|nr:L,D-transpeptidase family protein [Parvibaculaceae bacterium]
MAILAAAAWIGLAAGMPAHAQSAAGYGQDQTHWVDPWSANSETQSLETEVAPRHSAVPAIGEGSAAAIVLAIQKYQEIASWGGWGHVPAGERLELGVRDERVARVRERLMASGDLNVSPGDPFLYDPELEQAVTGFQRRNGLEPDGIVGRRTIAAMNVSVQTRLRQLELNLRRVEKLVPQLQGRYIFVNIAGQEVEAVNHGAVEFHERVIVGTTLRQTPEITSHVNSITFNPYWYVPKSIAMADMLPKIRANPQYLQRQGIRVMQGWGDNIRELDPSRVDWSNPRINEAYYLRQDPGPWNSLGSLKINFPNNDAIFLHDTPTQTLFGRQERNFSSGCVRVQNVAGLVSWIMQGDSPDWDASRVQSSVASGQFRNVYLAAPVPIFLTYLTAWVDPSGVVQFRDDVYARDGGVNTSSLTN